jgi:hypothetical protein
MIPQFRIWPEITAARTLYIARRLRRGTHPHTLVTADLNELRAALSEDPDNTRSQSVSWARELGLLER